MSKTNQNPEVIEISEAKPGCAPVTGSAKSYHMSQSVRGPLLNWSEHQWENATTWITRNDGTRFTRLELKAAFLEHLAQGHAVIPMGDCDNFDWLRGCQGHSPND